ncbi:hypothetical protein [Gloeomargarita sp.]
MVQTKRWLGILTLVWVGLAFVGGGVASWFGYRLGQEALRRVRQPVLNPVADVPHPTSAGDDPEPFRLLDEAAVIQQVAVVMGTGQVAPIGTPSPATHTRLPLLAVQEGGVLIALEQIESVGNQTVLTLRIQNERATAVQLQRQFIVRDDQGNILDPEVTGLPVQLAPGNQATAVQVRLPAGLPKVRVGLTEIGQTIPFVEIRDIPLPGAQPVASPTPGH